MSHLAKLRMVHPQWCDPTLCTAQPFGDGFGGPLEGSHHSTPVELRHDLEMLVNAAFLLRAGIDFGEGKTVMWLTQPHTLWQSHACLRIGALKPDDPYPVYFIALPIAVTGVTPFQTVGPALSAGERVFSLLGKTLAQTILGLGCAPAPTRGRLLELCGQLPTIEVPCVDCKGNGQQEGSDEPCGACYGAGTVHQVDPTALDGAL